MKKFLSFMLTVMVVFTAMLGFSSCKTVSRWTKWYKLSTLDGLGLEDLPKPNFDYVCHDDIFRRIDGIIEEKEFNEYVQEVFEYLSGKFECLGTPGEFVTDQTMFSGPNYAYIACENELEDFKIDLKGLDKEICGVGYMFLYFSNEPNERNKWTTTFLVSLDYYFEPITIIQNDEEYTSNFRITLKAASLGTTEFIDYESMFVDCYKKCNPEYEDVELLNYYGRDEDYLVWIAMMDASNAEYSEESWTESVAGYDFHYPNGNRILVADFTFAEEPKFYTLTEIYGKYKIDYIDIQRIYDRHKKFYPALYQETVE